MLKKTTSLFGLVLLATAVPIAGEKPSVMKHLDIYHEPGRFGGWPANHGIWSWGNEIVVGFEAGYFERKDEGHAINREKPAEHLLARSLDGGETWVIEHPSGLKPPPGAMVAGVPTVEGGKQAADCPGGIDFTAPGFALTARMESIHTGPSRFYYSYDKGKSWQGPFKIPNFGQKGIAARTDYLVNGKHDLTMFLTAAKSNGREGRVICVRTKDGAKTWDLASFIGPEPEGDGYAIMPSSLRLSPTTILTTVRRRHWIESYRSEDDGKTWSFEGKPVPDTGRGNPPALVKLADGRLVITYGYRAEPAGIRARFSSDNGRTWGNDFILRDDGGSWDLGYTRTVQRPDGNLVTVYYYNLDNDKERFIGATIWNPGSK